MKGLVHFYNSTVGKKVIVALTGAGLFLFVIGHMVGNLKVFMGYDRHGVHHIDAYGHFLRTILEDAFGYSGFLWVARVGLLAMAFAHIVVVIQLQRIKNAARPIDYKKKKLRASSFAGMTMIISGFIVASFVIFHLLHLTLGTVLPGFVEGEVYANLHRAFKSPLPVLAYIISMLAISSHLRHGLWSMFQTLGLDSPDRNPSLRMGASALSVLILLGFLAVPLSIFFGILEPPSNF